MQRLKQACSKSLSGSTLLLWKALSVGLLLLGLCLVFMVAPARAQRGDLDDPCLSGSDAPDQILTISTRSTVSPGNEGEMIAGFAIGGTISRRVLIKVLGPSLSNPGAGFQGLPDPEMEVGRVDITNPTRPVTERLTTLITIDDWQNDNTAADVAEIRASGLDPADPLEPAWVTTLVPGRYGVTVRARGTDSGAAVVAVFDISDLQRCTMGDPRVVPTVFFDPAGANSSGETPLSVGELTTAPIFATGEVTTQQPSEFFVVSLSGARTIRFLATFGSAEDLDLFFFDENGTPLTGVNSCVRGPGSSPSVEDCTRDIFVSTLMIEVRRVSGGGVTAFLLSISP